MDHAIIKTNTGSILPEQYRAWFSHRNISLALHGSLRKSVGLDSNLFALLKDGGTAFTYQAFLSKSFHEHKGSYTSEIPVPVLVKTTQQLPPTPRDVGLYCNFQHTNDIIQG